MTIPILVSSQDNETDGVGRTAIQGGGMPI
jgi:hypothetical protein